MAKKIIRKQSRKSLRKKTVKKLRAAKTLDGRFTLSGEELA